jgi:alkanesulfonate monooxygenase SsuD/methylene tetrahydromethanopterin reductase-like flavin-dependent oxidoreductase (luciferase family)
MAINGFRLGIRPEVAPPILVAALRQGMLELAGREADGAIVNWLSADDVSTVAPIVRRFAEKPDGSDKEIAARIFVCPTEDVDLARAVGRYAIAAYLTVPVYAAFHEWLGRGEQLAGLWEHWKAGDRPAALEAIPDSLIDELIVHGSAAECRAHVQRYVDNGVSTPVLAVLPVPGLDLRQALRDLAPTA